MKILLINPPNIEESKVEAHTIPLGLLYIKEFLCLHNYEVKVLNFYFERNWQNIYKKLSRLDFHVIGIPCYTRQRFSAIKLAEVCKEINNRAFIVLGGPHATFLDIQILRRIPSIDFIIRNEGELTFLELLKIIKLGNYANLYAIKGLTFREDESTIIKNSPRHPIVNLSDFPPPRYSYRELMYFSRCESLTFHFESIRNKINTNNLIAPILASRGCNNTCLFCCNGTYWKNQYYYSPNYVFKHILEINKKFNINLFDFYDDDLPNSIDNLNAICDLIINNDLDISWWCSSRAQNLNEEILIKMKKAGCFMISYGVESGSEYILKNINKNLHPKEIKHVIELTKKVGLKLRVTISIGHPGENDKSIIESIDFLNKSKPDQIGLFIVKMYPGTPLYCQAIKNDLIDDDYWFDKNNFDIPFYIYERTLDQLLAYRNMIRSNLNATVLNEYENKVYSLELDLKWK